MSNNYIIKKNVSIEWCIEKLEALQQCNLNPKDCKHDHTGSGEIQPFDYASIDMALDSVIEELKRIKRLEVIL